MSDRSIKQIRTLAHGWTLQELDLSVTLDAAALTAFAREDRERLAIAMPRQVQEALWEAGRIEDPAGYGAAAQCAWVGKRNWLYRLTFDAPAVQRQRLCFPGLDTVAVIVLNGEEIARHENIYLPCEVDVSGHLKERGNELLVAFQSPYGWLAEHPLPPHLHGKVVNHNRMLRKPQEDFNSFNGAKPHYTTIGIFRDVELHLSDTPEIRDLQLAVSVAADRSGTVNATVDLLPDGTTAGDLRILTELIAPGGSVVAVQEDRLPADARTHTVRLTVEQPRLWFPRGYGEQPLYRFHVSLFTDGSVIDRAARHFGFRQIEVSDELDVTVNGLSVRLWGANWTPVEGRSKRYFRERTHRTLDLAENANLVALRFWGPGAPWDEDLYDECDRRGILVWTEFFHTWGVYPDMPDYLGACRQEAIHEVRRLNHHSSIFLWCGGNEVYMGWEREHGNTDVPGIELYESIYPDVVRTHDPEQRHYLVNSPCGGEFPNDARSGVSHGYTHQNFVPGEYYPGFLAENTRVSTPLLKSMERFIPPDGFWPPDFTGLVPIRRRASDEALPQGVTEEIRLDAAEMPPSWVSLTLGADFLVGRLGPVGDFYDTGDTPKGLIYRLGAAHGRWIRDSVERYRRGRPWYDPSGPRRTRGHFLWKLNSTWPMIFSDVIDYFVEPNIAYYSLKRAYSPLMASFDISDHVRLWVINDRAEAFRGTLEACLYNGDGTRLLYRQAIPVSIGSGCAELVGDMDGAGMFLRMCNLYARLVDDDGREVFRTNDICGIERNIGFPNAQLSLAPNETGDGVIVTTNTFARAVELEGMTPDGDPFGWLFEDNFFDLLPHERKEVRFLGKHRRGTVRASSLFVEREARVLFPG